MHKEKIIAHFLKIDVSDLTNETVMDHTVVPSSVMLHRMYAALADKGYIANDPASIVTYGDFLKSIGKDQSTKENISAQHKKTNEFDESVLSVGIDIEELSNFEIVDSYQDDSFYKSNFSAEEIRYCELRVDPRVSFAGLFVLKEAVVKADNSLKKYSFSNIVISHTDSGKPLFKGFSISLSHSDHHVVAVACKLTDKLCNDPLPSVTELGKEMRSIVYNEIYKNNKYLLKIIVSISISVAIALTIYSLFV